jgi:Putative peptidoglycan binding domain
MRRWLVLGVILLLVAAGVAVAVTDPFSSSTPPGSAGIDNGYPTALQTVVRRDLTSQTQVDGTLGYADPSTISLPAGTAPSSVQQAQQQAASAESSLQAAQATLTDDSHSLEQARATLAADRGKQAVDCRGGNAATSAAGTPGASASPCAADVQAAAADQQAVNQDATKVEVDRRAVTSAQTALAGAEQSLADSRSSAAAYAAGATYTMLPEPGSVIRRGQSLYAIGGAPTLLLYGPAPAWRALRAGMSPGRDVAELNANLQALGYGHGLAGASFTSATGQAVAALQAARGLSATGTLALGSVVFSPGPVRVTSVMPTVGAAAQPGPMLTITSTHHVVAIQLDAAQQSQVKVGDKVVVILPDNSTTPGVVSKVGKVATVPSDQGNGGGPGTPTVEVDVTLLHEAAAGSLDQAPVSLSVTTGSVSNVLVVPVNALVALAGGGYAVEVAGAGGAHQLVAVRLGLFDDADGLVEVSGPGLAAGQRVVVPGS